MDKLSYYFNNIQENIDDFDMFNNKIIKTFFSGQSHLWGALRFPSPMASGHAEPKTEGTSKSQLEPSDISNKEKNKQLVRQLNEEKQQAVKLIKKEAEEEIKKLEEEKSALESIAEQEAAAKAAAEKKAKEAEEARRIAEEEAKRIAQEADEARRIAEEEIEGITEEELIRIAEEAEEAERKYEELEKLHGPTEILRKKFIEYQIPQDENFRVFDVSGETPNIIPFNNPKNLFDYLKHVGAIEGKPSLEWLLSMLDRLQTLSDKQKNQVIIFSPKGEDNPKEGVVIQLPQPKTFQKFVTNIQKLIKEKENKEKENKERKQLMESVKDTIEKLENIGPPTEQIGKGTEGEVTEGEVTEGEVTEGEGTEGEVTEGEGTEGEEEEVKKTYLKTKPRQDDNFYLITHTEISNPFTSINDLRNYLVDKGMLNKHISATSFENGLKRRSMMQNTFIVTYKTDSMDKGIVIQLPKYFNKSILLPQKPIVPHPIKKK